VKGEISLTIGESILFTVNDNPYADAAGFGAVRWVMETPCAFVIPCSSIFLVCSNQPSPDSIPGEDDDKLFLLLQDRQLGNYILRTPSNQSPLSTLLPE
jgi:hypothetical protein